ncbi:S9 family peptidase [Massilia sp. 9096]|uniref:alpha/beta hydrolase family protein n=1 Tax=Massilia sp. 9096 TaxID=1500894 RepID=UPI0005615896|nr:prolyl oligopeptidase family serine peptidase [Massilia sp. 9096]
MRIAHPLLLALALSLHAAPACFAAEAPIPIAAFFENPALSGAKLSPDGKRLAMRVTNSKGRDQLGVVNLADNAMQVVGGFADDDVGRFEWVNDNRLLFDSRDNRIAPGRDHNAPGLFAVNADGSAYRQLATVGFETDQATSAYTVGREKLPWNTFMLDQAGAQDSDWVYVEMVKFSRDGDDVADLIRLNTVTGRTESVDGPGRVREWWLDAKGKPALAITVDGNTEVLHYLDPKTGKWRKLATDNVYLSDAKTVTPLGFAPTGELYVTSYAGRDKSALFAYDLATGTRASKPLVDLEEYDFSGSLIVGAGKLLGVRYTVDAQSAAWFDPAMKKAQETVDKLLPGCVNVLSVGVRSETPFVLVESWSDRQPPVTLLFNRDTGKLARIGASRPALPTARMARQSLVQVKARDGQIIPTWVTIPHGSEGKKLPMVVLVHGGPYVRGSEWGWDSQGQFLASRGYVVLEPEFRGSTGYGAAHFRAGWKQWGLAMQDDVADATRWAIGEGIADPKRICIGGASYGGYATLMGLIRDPDLYKCGIDWVGVTDIELLYNGHWSADSDLSEGWKRYGMPTLVGDPVKDAAQFAQTSPLRQAARITQPLLLAYGGVDQRVPIYHGKKFYDAVRQTNKNVEWIEYEQEGHGWTLVETRLDFWGRVEKFLQKQIGSGGEPPR